MSERKVINKWIDPEFDPSKVDIEKKPERNSCRIRMMLPMTVKCLNCNNYMGVGKKYNMIIEKVLDEDYLGVKIYRFYYKCDSCFKEVTFKTDPKNSDYICEWGIKKVPQIWKDLELAEEEFKSLKKKEMKEDAMKSLEYKKQDTKIEMDILEAIDQVRCLNKKLGILNVEDSIREILDNKRKEEEAKEKEKAESKLIDEINREWEQKVNMHLKNKRINDITLTVKNKPSADNNIKENINKAQISKFLNKNSFTGNLSESESD